MARFEFDPNGEIVRLIYEHDEKSQSDSRRAHLGCSILGKECAREIWYSFRWASRIVWEGRMLRLFSRGGREEDVLVKSLQDIGCEVWDVDPRTWEQFRVKFASGHIGGSADGVCRGVPGAPDTPHLVEFKTHNDRSFKDMKAKGLADSKPQHLIQMQLYMKGLKLKRGLYVAVNKNNDELYTERISYHAGMANQYLERGKDIVASDTPPPKISQRPDWYKCKFCNFSEQCHYDVPLNKNCRTCESVEVHDEGQWVCGLDGDKLPLDKQRNGCERWQSV